MIVLQSAHRVLNEAERQIRTLIDKAVESTDYDSIAALADLAKKIRELTSKVPPSDRVASRSKPHLRKKAARDLRSERKTSRPYPCFYREGTTLVKVGWSKSSSSEYYHRASKDEVFGAVVVLRNLASQFGRFAVAQVLTLITEEERKDLPDYKVYLCLAWLRSVGLAAKHGRNGYSLPSDFDESHLQEAWDRIEERGEPK